MTANAAATKKYVPSKSTISIDGQEAASYGIGIIEDSFLVDVVQDVSLDPQFVCRLVDLCNVKQVSACHLRDIIEDALN